MVKDVLPLFGCDRIRTYGLSRDTNFQGWHFRPLGNTSEMLVSLGGMVDTEVLKTSAALACGFKSHSEQASLYVFTSRDAHYPNVFYLNVS